MTRLHLPTAVFLLIGAELRAQDCNANGVPDDLDLRPSLGLHAAPLLRMPGSKTLIAAADFDGDGAADFVAASETLGAFPVQAQLNDGKGGFRPGSTYNLLSEATDVAAADLDGDGDQDVAATSVVVTCCPPPGRTWVLWNDGEGNLSRGPLLQSTEAASTPRCVVPLDVDGDSDVDLAVPGGDASTLSIYYNDGKGEFGEERLFMAGQGTNRVATADIDSDGDLDLAANVYDPGLLGVALLLNDGDGSFVPSGVLGLSRGASAITTGDLDGDGHPEVVALTAHDVVGAAVRVHWNAGDGTFEALEGHQVPGAAMEIEAADLNGDGALDVTMPTHGTEGVAILFNEGERSFSTLLVPVAERSTASLPLDIEGNGFPDLLVPLSEAFVVVLENEGEGRFVVAGQIDVQATDAFAAEDMDGDGRLDLLGLSNNPRLWVTLHDGDLSFQDPVRYTWPVRFEMMPIDLRAVDLDGDGDVDVAVLGEGRSSGDPGTISVLLNDGDGLLEHSMNREIAPNPNNLVAADFDGDGRTDIATSSSEFMPPGEISVFLNRGDAFLEPAEHLAIEARPGSLGAGDLDGAGGPDILFLMDGSLWAFLNDGGGGFSLLRIFDSGPGRAAPVLADLDGDADLDVMIKIALGITILMNRGNSVFEKSVELPIGSSTHNLVAVDLDGDGDRELVAPDPGLAVLENLGKAEFLPPRLYDKRGNGLMAVAADLDTDGDPDLLVGSPGDISFIENISQPAVSTDLDSNSIPDECELRIFRRGDVNDDGGINIVDPVFLLNFLFRGGPGHRCAESADQDNDGIIGLTDAVHLLNYLFLRGPTAPPPGPSACGPDPDPPGSAGALGCHSYTSC